ncbi:phasin family protein [Maricaulis salignorans]|uniref:Phasin family protein n=1 Tax=Maricaulis salignorans TaxID=144026 RepID=A0A1G9UIE5_9PROT|nr:TIGR01841 family phasin [Maricaulis salignorans]SDM59701.1 phasin family protein [Maricaulis salignorans]
MTDTNTKTTRTTAIAAEAKAPVVVAAAPKAAKPAVVEKPAAPAKPLATKPAARTKPAAKSQAAKKKTGVSKPAAAKTPKLAASKPAAPAKQKPATSKPAVKAQTKTSTLMNNTIESMTAATNDSFKEGVEKTLSAVNEATAFHKDTVEAVIASATVTGKGLETAGSNAAAYAKTAMEEGVAATKALSSAKSLQEIFEIQSNYAKSAMGSYLAELNKTTELFSGLVKDGAKPLNTRFAAVAELAQSQR